MQFVSENLEPKFDISSVSILGVAQRCGVQIQKVGHHYLARCPFHGIDNTPSLVFYLPTNSWTCFGKCPGKNGHHNGGGPVQFVMQYYHYSFVEAAKWIEKNFDYFEPVIIKKEETIVKPVPHPWVIYWHSLLGEHRQYFKDRGFTDKTIDQEMWGWNGSRYCLPVWEGEPGNSEILGVRQRKQNTDKGEKYIGLKDMNPPTVWGRGNCKDAKTVLAFAGEFDAALANQDGFSSFSLVNGIKALSTFPENWPCLWFPNSQRLIAIFDKKEESFAGRLCIAWNRIKGSMMGQVFHWPITLEYKDYCEFRKNHSVEEFRLLFEMQGLDYDN